MKLKKYIKTVKEPLRKATLCFLVRGESVLLARKKRGFAQGKLNGVGGKVNDGETVEEAAKRETYEEIGVTITTFKQVAILDFYHTNNNFNQQVFVFKVKDWEGEPKESEEMKPHWYSFANLPFKKMWVDDLLWLPLILNGEHLKASFLFNDNEEIMDHFVEEINRNVKN